MTVTQPDPELADRTSSQTIVVGFDGEESGDDALVLGRTLAELTGGRVVAANVYPFGMPLSPETVPRDLDAVLERRAQETLDHAEAALEGLPGWERSAVVAGSPARGLHELAEQESAAFIVVGSSHRHHSPAGPGTTSMRLVRGAPCAVAIAASGWRARAKELREIGVGFDGSEAAHRALDLAARLARRAGAALHVLTVFERPHPAHPMFAVTTHGYQEQVAEMRKDVERQLDHAASALGNELRIETQVLDGRPAPTLADQARTLDLLVIGSRAYGPVRTVIAGSVSAQLAAAPACSLIVVPRGAERLPGDRRPAGP